MLKSTAFRAFGQRVGGSSNLVFIGFTIPVEDLDIGDLPNIFTIDGVKLAPTIYTGTYPQLKFNPTTVKDRDDLKGIGIAVIVTEGNVFAYKTNETKDLLSLGLK